MTASLRVAALGLVCAGIALATEEKVTADADAVVAEILVEKAPYVGWSTRVADSYNETLAKDTEKADAGFGMRTGDDISKAEYVGDLDAYHDAKTVDKIENITIKKEQKQLMAYKKAKERTAKYKEMGKEKIHKLNLRIWAKAAADVKKQQESTYAKEHPNSAIVKRLRAAAANATRLAKKIALKKALQHKKAMITFNKDYERDNKLMLKWNHPARTGSIAKAQVKHKEATAHKQAAAHVAKVKKESMKMESKLAADAGLKL